jgi:hypothetical protein
METAPLYIIMYRIEKFMIKAKDVIYDRKIKEKSWKSLLVDRKSLPLRSHFKQITN